MGQLQHYQAPLEGEILTEREHDELVDRRWRDERIARMYAQFMYEAYWACRTPPYEPEPEADTDDVVEAFIRFSGYAFCVLLVVWAIIVIKGA